MTATKQGITADLKRIAGNRKGRVIFWWEGKEGHIPELKKGDKLVYLADNPEDFI